MWQKAIKKEGLPYLYSCYFRQQVLGLRMYNLFTNESQFTVTSYSGVGTKYRVIEKD